MNAKKTKSAEVHHGWLTPNEKTGLYISKKINIHQADPQNCIIIIVKSIPIYVKDGVSMKQMIR